MKKLILILALFSLQNIFAQKTKPKNAEPQKTTEQKFELDKDKKTLFNIQFLKFVEALKTNDKAAMEALLSDKARQVVSEKVYTKLSQDISKTRKFEIIKTGYKALIDGGNYPMIQYKYADDKSAEPKEIITAVFEEDGRILGIKPFKASEK